MTIRVHRFVAAVAAAVLPENEAKEIEQRFNEAGPVQWLNFEDRNAQHVLEQTKVGLNKVLLQQGLLGTVKGGVGSLFTEVPVAGKPTIQLSEAGRGICRDMLRDFK